MIKKYILLNGWIATKIKTFMHKTKAIHQVKIYENKQKYYLIFKYIKYKIFKITI